jgi:hypothetical protein
MHDAQFFLKDMTIVKGTGQQIRALAVISTLSVTA